MLTQEALDFALGRVPSVDPALRPNLLDAYLVLDAFADARACLHDLKQRGIRTAILSNGSPRMLRAAVASIWQVAHWSSPAMRARCHGISDQIRNPRAGRSHAVAPRSRSTA